jgi:hypothetical protein
MFASAKFDLGRITWLSTAVILALVSLPAAASAKTLYVNGTTGNDATTYAANGPSSPWRTIGRAAWGSTNREARVSSEAARAGDEVIVAAGTYAAGQGTDQRSTPLLYTQNEGAPGNPIVFRADGTVYITQTGVGPVIGSYDRDYITWDGFTIDEAQARSKADTGPVVLWYCTGCVLQNLNIIGNGNDFGRMDNHTGIRVEQSNDITIRGNRIRNVYSAANRNNGAGVMTYSSHNMVIEYNEISECGAGVFLKGGPYRAPSNSIVRFNLIHHTGTGTYPTSADGAAVALHAGAAGTASGPVLVYQNILRDGAHSGVRIWGFDGVSTTNNPMHVKVFNNTIDNMPIGVYVDSLPVAGASHLVTNNVITRATEVIAYNTQSGSPSDTGRISFTRNVGMGQTWAVVPVDVRRNLAQWQAATGQDAASVAVDPQYVGGGEYRLAASSPARSVGRVVFGVGGANGSTIPAGAYISGSELIGTGVNYPPLPTSPQAPRNLRITGSN